MSKMSVRGFLHIGKKEYKSWNYFFPPIGDMFLSYIFDENDKVIKKFDGDDSYYCQYITTVKKVKRKFCEYNITLDSLDNCISKLLKLKKKDIPFALLSDLEFEEKYVLKVNKSVDKWELKDYVDNKTKLNDLGILPELRKFVIRLNKIKKNHKIIFDFSELELFDTEEEWENFSYLREDLVNANRLEKDYLNSSKINFLNYNFDFVYIELIIALSKVIKKYLKEKLRLSKRVYTDLKIEKIFKELSFLKSIDYIFLFLNRDKVDINQYGVIIKEVEKVYHIRNNIIHGEQKNFIRDNVNHDIKVIENLINMINSL